ncbi:MAG: PSD1 and planctomycete cytochrome C domain-containing protein [Bryobacteraceae bacterium]|nr:PSD1 and planctomycete cytochrome C domain-containing protein [Bryobacteraceae bacterium]MDW8379575.1 PSD1 and planctomycete cytochrome C domain-containing protein [Bryobacterales bacterium]
MKAVLLLVVSALTSAVAQDRSPGIDFVQQIQPVFEKNCYGCHGAKAQLGGLRLDSKKLAFAGGQSGPAIVAGNAEKSPLYQRIAGIGDQARMPMGGKPLEASQIAAIRDWINQGAFWPDGVGVQNAEIKKHWAFVPPKRPALPAVRNRSWPRNPIDYFILARLEKEGLMPAPQADKVTLLRRLSLDLIGLPPTIAEVEAFLNDKSHNAYEKQVERLLASPHYGERWARHWLDAARYADSDGFEKDKPRWVWFYRDWVISALNRDMPYDRFLIEQLAGDLLPNATQQQRVATGFLRNSMINEEGGIDPEQFRMEAMFDRMDAIGKSILGLTIQCGQCHNHKYDPLTQEDYYRMFAFLNNSHEAAIAVYTEDEERKRQQVLEQIRQIERDLQQRKPDWEAAMAAWEEKVRHNQPRWIVLKPEVDDISTGGQKYLLQEDLSLLAAGYAPTKHKAKFTLRTDQKRITALRLDLLNDPNLPLGGPGRSIKGTGALTEIEIEAAPAGDDSDPRKVKIVQATASVNPPEKELEPIFFDKSKNRRVTGPIAFAIDGDDNTAWGIDIGPVRRNQPQNAVFVFEKPVENPNGTVLTVYLSQRHGGWNSDDNQNHNLGRIRLSITDDDRAAADPVPAQVREILAIPRAQRTAAQQQAVFSYWRTSVPEWAEANQRVEELWRQHPEGTSQLVLQERETPRPTHILVRGDFLKPGKRVEPGTPAFLHPMPAGAPRNRLGFAQWITDRNSPTTARAMVNRIWQSYFGAGLVQTSEDLGKQSEPPSHPELLDWLAVEFMDQGWSMKHLHRLIVTSATYQQSSKVSRELLERDPFNRLLARGPRFRVEGEIVRDIALAASGLLNPKIGGPSVYAPAPDFLFLPPASYGPKQWHEETGENRYRRALYTFRYRSVPYPMLQAFDTPNGDMACVRRSRSNTPLQALTTLNEPLFLEAARALALKTVREGGPTDAERLEYAFRRCLARKPEPRESAELLGLLRRQAERFRSGEADPAGLVEKAPTGVDAAELGGWVAVSRVLLNLDETITKE